MGKSGRGKGIVGMGSSEWEYPLVGQQMIDGQERRVGLGEEHQQTLGMLQALPVAT